jgi:hypothetical protein
MKARRVSSRTVFSEVGVGDAKEVGGTAQLYTVARREWRTPG